ncbi:hypothetical protein BH09PAT4_BH09PAT4_08300 [soil metagenome]
MKRRVGTSGFTIMETMIVLAVTAGLFVLIAATLGGRQRSNEFTQAINDVRTVIQQAITETQSGFYANKGDFTCTRVGMSANISGSANTQGKNKDCVFLGKVIQFGIAGTDPEEARVYPIVGLRTATSFVAAAPTPVYRSGVVNESTDFKLKYGLKTVKMVSGGSQIGAFGVLSSIDSSNPGKSGDQQFSVYGVRGTNITSDSNDQAAQHIQSAFASGSYDINPSGGVKVCFESGGTPQYGLVTVGDNGGQLSVDLKIIDKSMVGTPCGI